jgi:hypothetical protein
LAILAVVLQFERGAHARLLVNYETGESSRLSYRKLHAKRGSPLRSAFMRFRAMSVGYFANVRGFALHSARKKKALGALPARRMQCRAKRNTAADGRYQRSLELERTRVDACA